MSHNESQRTALLTACRSYNEGQIAYHLANLEVLIRNAVGVAEHPDIMETMNDILDKCAIYEERIHIIDGYLDTSPSLHSV